TLFWPSLPGTSKTNQRSILHQQQQFFPQGRFSKRKSSFAVQTLTSSRRLNSYRQSGDNLLQALPKRPGLRRTLSQGDFSRLVTRKKFMPLVKFRRVVKMILILLKATYNDRKGGQRRERYLSLWASVLNGKFGNSRRAYEMYGISFDPQEFKANTEVQVSAEAKAILSLEPGQRSAQQLRQALASLRQAVEEFSEFPITMQESLARVGRYEHFEAKRVIIRQGHLAENFYFILSGTAVVTILDTNKVTGEQTARTVTFLGKGKSFGELALMYKSRRTATVRCQEDVELLAVGREDFVDIFMHVEGDVEPEHVRFLRSLHVLRGWPVDVLPANNPLVFVFTYVRRGIVLCKDSNSSDWIYVVKSGSCRVIKALRHGHAQQTTSEHRRDTKTKDNIYSVKKLAAPAPLPIPVLPPIQTVPQNRERIKVKTKTRFLMPGTDVSAEKMERVSLEHYSILDAIHRVRHRRSLSGQETGVSEATSRTESMDSEKGDNIVDTDATTLAKSTVFVDLLTLHPGDIYGLESCVFRSMGSRTTSTSLVSAGAEVIMINRKFFLDHTSEQLRKRIRREIRPLPSEETLQSQLETKISWEAFRHDTLQKTLQLRQKIGTHACAF
ncbi:cyclic nucleotide-binding domain-containing protein 2-like, partial [Plakobranchus ocellatus]